MNEVFKMTAKKTEISIGVLLAFFTLLVVAQVGFSQAKKPVTAAAKFRLVTIVTQPSAAIWIDGVLFGKAGSDGRLEIKSVSAGAHSIRVRADGFTEKLQTLAAAQKGEIKIGLIATTDEAELAFQEAERLTTSDREKAIIAYKNAIKLRPNYPDAFLALARTQSDTGDLEEAQRSINAARKLRPNFAEATAVEGRILKESGEEQKAIAAFKRSITEGKGFQPEALTGLGLLYKERAEGSGGAGGFDAERANYTESAKYLKLALKQLSGAPDALVIYQLLGLVYERQQKYAEAIATYEEFLRLFPDSIESSAVQSFIVQLRKQARGEQ